MGPSPSGSFVSVQSFTSGTIHLNAGDDVYVFAGGNSFGGGIRVYLDGGATLYTLTHSCDLSLGPSAQSAELVACYNTTSTYQPNYGVVRVTVQTTGPYRIYTLNGCTFGCPQGVSTGWALAPGKTAPNLLGYVGEWVSGSGYVLRANIAVQGEAALMASQTSKLPVQSKFTWTRLNPPVNFAFLNGVGTGGNIAEIAQSFPAPVGGAYLETTRIGMFGSGNYNCGGTLRISITNTLSVPWNELAEVAAVQVPWTLGGSAPTNNYVTVNWVIPTITEDASTVSFGTPVWSIAGTPVTGENLKHLAPWITPNQGTYFLRAYWDQGNCGGSAYVMSRYSGSNGYAGGSAYSVSGGAWVEQPSQDLGGLALGAYGGNKTYEWQLNATHQNTGGATYVYIAEHSRDTITGLAKPQSSWGGAALAGKDLFELAGSAGSPECAFHGISNSECLITEYRLGYMRRPFDAISEPLTVTMNLNGMGRNPLYVGTFQNQPAQTHVKATTWDWQQGVGGDLVIYQFWSTDDHHAFVEFTIRECANAACDQFGATLTNVSYLADICNGVRTKAGNPDANGRFNVSGQDLPGCRITVTLTGSGYSETVWRADIMTGGTHAYTLGIFKAGGGTGSAQLAATTITFEGDSARHIPDRLNITITRGRSAALFIGLDRVDAGTGLVQHNVITATYWKPHDANVFQFYYPTKAKSGPADVGVYILWVMNETGAVVNHHKMFILPPGGMVGDYDVSITADMIRGIERAGYVSAQQTFQSQHQASLLATQKSVREQVYEDFQKISDYGWFFLAFLLFLGTVRAFRR